VTSVSDEAPLHFRVGDVSALGTSSFVADLSADRPAQDLRVSLGSEQIRIDSISQ
jgi:hypothetical protein